MKKMKWRCVFFIGLSICTALFLFVAGKKNEESCGVQICVLDAYNLSPIKNAFVLLPETGASQYTDENGTARFSRIPFAESFKPHFPKKGYGEITVLVYCENYLPFALFYAQVFPGKMRTGPNVYLFPVNTEADTRVISMVESPQEEWVEQLIKEHAPQ